MATPPEWAPTLCRRLLVRGFVAQLLLRAGGSFVQSELCSCPPRASLNNGFAVIKQQCLYLRKTPLTLQVTKACSIMYAFIFMYYVC